MFHTIGASNEALIKKLSIGFIISLAMFEAGCNSATQLAPQQITSEQRNKIAVDAIETQSLLLSGSSLADAETNDIKAPDASTKAITGYLTDAFGTNPTPFNYAGTIYEITQAHYQPQLNAQYANFRQAHDYLLYGSPALKILTQKDQQKLGLKSEFSINGFSLVSADQYVLAIERSLMENKIDQAQIMGESELQTSSSTIEQNTYNLINSLTPLVYGNFIRSIEKFKVAKKVKPPPAQYRLAIMLNGFLTGLDPHSYLITTETLNKKLSTKTEEFGSFVGITFTKKDGKFLVVFTSQNSSARKAGIKIDDELIKVDSTPIKPTDTLKSATSLMDKPVGEKSKITVLRDGKEIEFELTHEKIKSENVTVEHSSTYDYYRLAHFGNDSDSLLEDAIANNQSKNIVLDLRGNGGGALDTAIRMIAMFTSKSVMMNVTVESLWFKVVNLKQETVSPQPEELALSNAQAPFKDANLIILQNELSASASEILISNLKHTNRALVIGRSTFGKGSMQECQPLSSSLDVCLTRGVYYTVNNFTPQKVGITPNIEVALSDADKIHTRNPSERDFPNSLESIPLGRNQFQYSESAKIRAIKDCVSQRQDAIQKTVSEIEAAKVEYPDRSRLTAEEAFNCYAHIQ